VAHRLTGGAELTVRVHVRQRLDFTRAVNVIGWLEGSELPDEWIILGSHYDPWSFGAHDPNGGTAMLLVLAEALGRSPRGLPAAPLHRHRALGRRGVRHHRLHRVGRAPPRRADARTPSRTSTRTAPSRAPTSPRRHRRR
jgi:hypothetical protein